MPARLSTPLAAYSILFDHRVGNGEQAGRDFETESPGGVKVDYQLEFGRLLDRNVARLGSAQYLVDEVGGAPECIVVVCSIRHQRSRFGVLPSAGHHRQFRAEG